MKNEKKDVLFEYKAKQKDSTERTYKIKLVCRPEEDALLTYGQSVDVYILEPTYEEMQKMLKEGKGEGGASLSHVMVDAEGRKCLSLCKPEDFQSPCHSIPVEEYVRRTIKWIIEFEKRLECL